MNKIFPVACSDDGWKACVAQLASDVDLILMDLTGLRENVLWELDLCDRSGLSNRLVLLADEREGKPAQRVAEQRGKDIYLYNNSGLAGELTLRQVIAETLARNGGAGSRVLDPVVDPQYKRRVTYRILAGFGLFVAIIVLVLMPWMLTSFR